MLAQNHLTDNDERSIVRLSRYVAERIDIGQSPAIQSNEGATASARRLSLALPLTFLQVLPILILKQDKLTPI